MSACDSRHRTTATNRRGGPRKAQERPSPPSPLPLCAERCSSPPAAFNEQKTGTLMLFPALDCRKHLASAVRLVTIDTGGERFGFFLPSIDVPEGQRRISTRLASTRCQRTKLDPASAVDLAVHRIGWDGADRDRGIIVYGL